MKADSIIERPKLGETAVLVHIDFNDKRANEDIAEFQELAISAGAEVLATVTGTRDAPDAKYFIGQGKAEEIRQLLSHNKAQLVLFNHALTPAQERNLEKLLHCRVLDRTGLILDIFAKRAKTFEGKLQVELAQLQHLSTRLVRGWTHLERQRGGIGLSGPGETQLETDRRLVRDRIKTINRRLEKVREQRDQNRKSRKKALLPTVSIVGYTNAGKSTLFNKLTGAEVYVANKLFATLDPTLRQMSLPGAGKIILADTVGFIRHLPHDLVEAFRATLEETRDASLLLHVIDVADEQRQAHAEQVDRVLEQIGASTVPQLLIYNKIDLLTDAGIEFPTIDYDQAHKPLRVRISAEKNIGLDTLRQAIADCVFGDPVYRTVCLGFEHATLRSQLYEMEAVRDEHVDLQGNWIMALCMSKTDFFRMFPEATQDEAEQI